MAKTIKFNLRLDGCPVRDLEGIQQHFSIEDMLDYYKSGLLLRWLEVRGYETQRQDVQSIEQTKDNEAIICELSKIFDVELDEDEIRKSTCIFEYLETREQQKQSYQRDLSARHSVIKDYLQGYLTLIQHTMVDHKDDMSRLKEDARVLEAEYGWFIDHTYCDLYYTLYEKAPKAVFALLKRDAFREHWIGESANAGVKHHIESELLQVIKSTEAWIGMEVTKLEQSEQQREKKLKEILGSDLKIFRGTFTNGTWKTVVPANEKVMILPSNRTTVLVQSAGDLNCGRSLYNAGKELQLLNGLEYRSDSSNINIYYLEV
jgi:hypothetical protein